MIARFTPSWRVPRWLLVVALLLAGAALYVATDESAARTLSVLSRGLLVTLRVTFVGFGLALAIGLLAGIGRTAQRPVIREVATLYVEVVRGIPLLVILLWFGFAFTPWLVSTTREAITALDASGVTLGGLTPWLDTLLAPCVRPSACIGLEVRGTLGLAIGYGAYIAEIVRAGIQSVAAGQLEAALSLGMSRGQAMRHVLLPQALRLALPPLGNDFIAMLKDSSLISVLSVKDVVFEARVHVSKTFQALEVWNLVAVLYLVITLSLSLGVRLLERRAAWLTEEAGEG